MDLLSKITVLKETSGFDFDADLFVGLLASLVGKQHAIVTVDGDMYLDFAEKMILLIASNIFGFTTTSVVCAPETTSEEFANSMLIASEFAPGSFSPLPSQMHDNSAEYPWHGIRADTDQQRGMLTQQQRGLSSRGQKFPNLVVIRNLDQSSNYVQAQLLEILRTKKLVTSKGLFMTPPSFLVIPLLSKGNMRLHLFPYLLDHFFISHNYEPLNADESSAKPGKWTPLISLPPTTLQCLFSVKDIESLSSMANSVCISAEMKRYMHDVMVFLRMHRAIRGGISARASKDFELLIRCLCPLHGIGFATPSIVVIAARKTYSHRITLATAQDERSVLYGSEPEALSKFIQHWTPDLVLDDVLDTVPAPM
ncbi:hypothetical protein POJ06DRAFT_9852 [Lipomyces tetrasporus]|uniref:Magnesium chelatase n=1 Tax=Lipomyces tetrasporus TaxID=54092 RepID=A0AAD7QYS8_9ASCO|nr:uncharacterized protein POJ06DRAFT_9852 [Lipomyces tetrasporus]KAJ8103949.1 hypothetical protein POJ06DRAFT_9852 [Lipomyces tetrasporus]